MTDTLECDCGSDDVAVSIEQVRPHGPRAVFTCGSCGVAWISTEPSVVEQVVVAVEAERHATGLRAAASSADGVGLPSVAEHLRKRADAADRGEDTPSDHFTG